MDHEPERISVDAEAVTIAWTDGVSTVVSGDTLRSSCPCAECREHESETPSIIQIGNRSSIADAQLIGGYAIRFTFGDGHADGLYPYEILRQLAE
ncbi:MAG: DUF971 domain-containing protein [Actinomycetota bacterium]|nr:DUF971 domain-containing protein [Actinomycetota bacterium]